MASTNKYAEITVHPVLPANPLQMPFTPSDQIFNYEHTTYNPVAPLAMSSLAPRQTNLKARLRNFVYITWLAEVTALGIAFISFLLVLALCVLFNHKEVEDDGFYSNTPSSLLNFLVSTMRTSLMVPIASGIAQLKWKWFNKSKQLSDLEVFDAALRSFIGSFHFLFRPKFW
jgi:hypothetical protein